MPILKVKKDNKWVDVWGGLSAGGKGIKMIYTYSQTFGNPSEVTLRIVYTDDTEEFVSFMVEQGTSGQDGVGVSKAEINSNDELVLYYSNGTNENLGKVVGANGIDGTNGVDGLTPYINDNGNWQIGDADTGIKAAGKDGADGKSIESMYIGDVNLEQDEGSFGSGTLTRCLVITYTDSTTSAIPLPDIFKQKLSIFETENGVDISFIDGSGNLNMFTITNGQDYVLTEEDKTELVDTVLNALPVWLGGAY